MRCRVIRSVMVVGVSAVCGFVGPKPARANVFIRGDVNSDGVIDISDPTELSNRLQDETVDDLSCKTAADANRDYKIDGADVDFLLAFLFSGGPPPGSLECESVYCDLNVSWGCTDTWCTRNSVPAPPCPPPPPTAGDDFIRGDVNSDGHVNYSDFYNLWHYWYYPAACGGSCIDCMRAADVDGNDYVDPQDISRLWSYLQGYGYPPPFPFPCCGGGEQGFSTIPYCQSSTSYCGNWAIEPAKCRIDD